MLVHLPCWLLHSSCTTQVRPLTVMVSPGPPLSQMSAISPQLLLLSPQAAGVGVVGLGVEADVRVGGRLDELVRGVSVAFSRAVALAPQPVEQGPVNSSISAP